MKKLNNVSFLFPYLIKEKLSFFIMIIALIASSLTVLIFSRYIGKIIDNFSILSSGSLFMRYFLEQNLLVVVLALSTALRYYFTAKIGERITTQIKSDFFSRLLQFSPSYFESNKVGEVLSQLHSDIQVLQNFLGRKISIFLRNMIMLGGSLIMLIISSYKLAILIFLLIPLVILPIKYIGKKIKTISKENLQTEGRTHFISEESLHSLRVVQAYTAEAEQMKKFNESINDLFHSSLAIFKLKAKMIFVVILLIFSGIGIIISYGGYNVLKGYITIGELSSFIFLSVICAGSVSGIMEIMVDFLKSSAVCDRLHDFFNIEIFTDKSDALSLKGDIQSINFENVGFSYPSKPNIKILDNFSCDIKKNEKVFIVGKSGIGKTTIFQLLLRFYDTQQGAIYINNTPLKKIKMTSLRRKIAYIPQDPPIFSATVYENIKFGNPNATHEEVIKVSKQSLVHDFVDKMPDKYQSYIGEKGNKISGGQKQRIAIARALLRNPDVFLFDEATSSLDYENEKILNSTIDTLGKNKIVIIVTHRQENISHANQIIYII